MIHSCLGRYSQFLFFFIFWRGKGTRCHNSLIFYSRSTAHVWSFGHTILILAYLSSSDWLLWNDLVRLARSYYDSISRL